MSKFVLSLARAVRLNRMPDYQLLGRTRRLWLALLVFSSLLSPPWGWTDDTDVAEGDQRRHIA
jgi:hypothetical protein